MVRVYSEQHTIDMRCETDDCTWHQRTTSVAKAQQLIRAHVEGHVRRQRSPFGPVQSGIVSSCRWADGEHGPCGGPSNGRECWQHATVATR